MGWSSGVDMMAQSGKEMSLVHATAERKMMCDVEIQILRHLNQRKRKLGMTDHESDMTLQYPLITGKVADISKSAVFAFLTPKQAALKIKN